MPSLAMAAGSWAPRFPVSVRTFGGEAGSYTPMSQFSVFPPVPGAPPVAAAVAPPRALLPPKILPPVALVPPVPRLVPPVAEPPPVVVTPPVGPSPLETASGLNPASVEGSVFPPEPIASPAALAASPGPASDAMPPRPPMPLSWLTLPVVFGSPVEAWPPIGTRAMVPPTVIDFPPELWVHAPAHDTIAMMAAKLVNPNRSFASSLFMEHQEAIVAYQHS